jgi:hypothetical protein
MMPALPVRNVTEAVAHYRDRFGFDARHETADYRMAMLCSPNFRLPACCTTCRAPA